MPGRLTGLARPDESIAQRVRSHCAADAQTLRSGCAALRSFITQHYAVCVQPLRSETRVRNGYVFFITQSLRSHYAQSNLLMIIGAEGGLSSRCYQEELPQLARGQGCCDICDIRSVCKQSGRTTGRLRSMGLRAMPSEGRHSRHSGASTADNSASPRHYQLRLRAGSDLSEYGPRRRRRSPRDSH